MDRVQQARSNTSDPSIIMDYEAGSVLEPATKTRSTQPRSPHSPSDDDRPSKFRRHGSKLVSAIRSFGNSGEFGVISSTEDTVNNY